MKFCKISALFVTFIAFVTVFGGATTQAQTFTDVKEKDAYYEAVEYLAKEQIISSSSKQFKPNDQVTRGQMAKMLALALKLDTKNVKDPKFKDVPKTHQFYPYIAALANKKIISGFKDGTFGVNKNVTKTHLAKFIVNGFDMPIRKRPEMHFPDVKENTEADIYAHTLQFYGITNYYKFNPNSAARRYIVAQFIYESLMRKSSIDNQKEVKLPFKVKKGEERFSHYSSLKASGFTDMVTNSFVLLPNGSERGHFMAAANQPTIAFNVNKQNKVTQLSYVNPVPFENYIYNGIGDNYYAIDEINQRVIVEVKYENVSNPQLPTVYGEATTNKYGHPVFDAIIYDVHGDAIFTDIYRQTIRYNDGATESKLLKNVGLHKSREIFPSLVYEGSADSVTIDDIYYEASKLKVEGPSQPKFLLTETLNYGGLTISKPGTYNFYVDGKLNSQLQVFEFNGKIHANWERLEF